MAISPFMAAINQLCDEKGLSRDIVIETIEAAIAAAYRKDFGKPSQIIKVKLDPDSGQTNVWQAFEVVQEIEDQESQKTLDEAAKIDPKAEIGGQVQIPLQPHSDFGRIAAQTAKQVIVQRIREAERDLLYAEYKEKEGKIITANVQQIEGNNVVLDLGKVNGLLISGDQVPQEKYYSGQRLKVLVKTVEESSRGPRILVSRSDPRLIISLFELEVPEIAAETVQIKGIAREAGSRTKMAVWSTQEGLDPVGSCVGQRGTRIQAVLAEIGEEKIDIILYNENDIDFIINALSPAKVIDVKLAKKEKKALVHVADDQLSLAIGKGGQNVRLASKLTGWSIDIDKIVPKKTTELDEKIIKETKIVQKKEKPSKKSVKKPTVKKTKAPTKKKVNKKSK